MHRRLLRAMRLTTSPLRRAVVVLLLVALLAGWPAPARALAGPSDASRAEPHSHQAVAPIGAVPEVDGTSLVAVAIPGVTAYADPDVDADVLATVRDAVVLSLAEVPELSGLPPFGTPIVAYVLADDERFRAALSEIAQVRVDLVAEDIGGYTIERDGVMLVFFAAPNVTTPASALLGYSHEFAHLAVREATQRRALPQWFNEGYASWIAWRSLARHFPDDAALQYQLDRMAVASALHTRGPIPWPDLVTRSRFSRAGVDGLVNLAYGQSTLFIDFLAQRHGTSALARFLTLLGEGNAATPAFAMAFGPFGREAAAFDQTLAALKDEVAPGLHVVQLPTPERAAILALVGGPALETATLELFADGSLTRRREFELDGGGLMVASLAAFLLADADEVRVQVTVPVLGALALDPRHERTALPVADADRGGRQAAPVPAPVQAPAGNRSPR